MENIWDAYQFLLFVADKNSNGYFPPEDAARALDAGQMSVFRYYYGDGNERGTLQTEALRPFGRQARVNADINGAIVLPADCVHLRRVEGYRESLQGEIPYALTSQIYPIEVYPRYTSDMGGIQLYPQQAVSVAIHYYKRAVTPVIAYTIPSEDPVYDPAASVQLGFDPRYWIEICAKALGYLGVKLNDAAVASLANQFETQPQ